ncbi:MAG: hypothetical protein D6694_14930 [Gammaproteobacteria bacterium]|nr:MAG: hypothetical protein D6694_14930 [Gammaproteobacteria bacterium]
MYWTKIVTFVFETILQEIVVVAAGVLFAHFVRRKVDEWRFGKWQVILKRGEQEILKRRISAPKVKSILDEPSELDDFLKGVVSPYAWIHCDIIEKGEELGLLKIDHQSRRFIIDLDKNPSGNKDLRFPIDD